VGSLTRIAYAGLFGAGVFTTYLTVLCVLLLIRSSAAGAVVAGTLGTLFFGFLTLLIAYLILSDLLE
jgi:hypothetical protein